ncbi:hypothetical protein C6I20_02750 [Aeromicrobium sp. A1-2]|uniref:hypothetical protein n=1 Tax=Aeromicrobium sp. A1-2 TaxID=2107713 RepID=UPI000E4DECF9|nr:hypothetical protein [Aeromicrobium sp. A1-2]AXT84216.1 hypothetical protein C6I20_02750 [Aeromicrobium sp. A1-2]
MKKILLVLSMVSACVFLAQPAVADEAATSDTTVGAAAEPATNGPAEASPAPDAQPAVVKAAPVAPKKASVQPAASKPGSGTTTGETAAAAADDKKVVVCKYVGTPPGTPDHIIVVSVNTLKDFGGTFPYAFSDAQDSVAIRYAIGNEQPGDEELVNCPGYVPPVVDVCPDIPGNQSVGTDCTPPATDVCPDIPGDQPVGSDCTPPATDVCPDIPGNQPVGTDCMPPVIDACDNIPGNQPEGTDCNIVVADEKKVVVCKYVGTPPGTPDHIIVVSEATLGNTFTGTFPFQFPDAQDSIAIRYAVGNEQPGDEELVNCPGYVPPVVDVCPDIPGNQPVGTDCTQPGTGVDGCPTIPGDQPVGTDCNGTNDGDDDPTPGVTPVDKVVAREDDMLPDTGGVPLWMLLFSGPLAAAGALMLKKRSPVAYAFSAAGGPVHSLSLPPVQRSVTEESHGARGLLRAMVGAVMSFFRGGRR